MTKTKIWLFILPSWCICTVVVILFSQRRSELNFDILRSLTGEDVMKQFTSKCAQRNIDKDVVNLTLLQGFKLRKIRKENLIYFPELSQMWCLVPKAGSTSWSKIILKTLLKHGVSFPGLGNASIPLQVILKEKYSRINQNIYDAVLRNSSIKKILLTRHPLTRIQSAYVDKLQNRHAKEDGMYFYQNYGSLINRNFRKNKRLIKQREPTFSEFVDYLISTSVIDYDEHWMPINILCDLCQVSYDMMIPVEKLSENQNILSKFLFDSSSPFPIENQRTNNKKQQFLYKELSREQVQTLYKKYELDYELLEYKKIVSSVQ